MKNPSLLITPPPANPDESDTIAIGVIHQLSKIMARKSTIQTMNHRIDVAGDDSVRRIQGGRYEVFVSDASDKPSTCFDQIVVRDQTWLPRNVKQILVDYAMRQARQNPDIGKFGKDYQFENFSLLVNGQGAQQQPRHIDMVLPNSQFGLMLTPNSPGTLVYHVNDTIQTIHDIKRIWNAWNGPDMPFMENLVTAFESSTQAKLLVHQFGNVLLPEEEMVEQRVEDDIPAGSLMMLPGGAIHAGPGSNEDRTVLFFSGRPSGHKNKMQPYHPDTQYSALFLCGQLVDTLWQSPGVGQWERDYLLRMLVKYQRQSSVERKLASHFPDGGIHSFVLELEDNAELSDENKLETLIKETAQDEMFCLFNIDGDFDEVSVEGLLTKWEGMEINVIVYRRTFDDKILLHYPNITEGSWEGGKARETYTLILNQDTTLPFDGSNGKLLDNDGDVIECYIRPLRRKKKPKEQRLK